MPHHRRKKGICLSVRWQIMCCQHTNNFPSSATHCIKCCFATKITVNKRAASADSANIYIHVNSEAHNFSGDNIWRKTHTRKRKRSAAARKPMAEKRHASLALPCPFQMRRLLVCVCVSTGCLVVIQQRHLWHLQQQMLHTRHKCNLKQLLSDRKCCISFLSAAWRRRVGAQVRVRVYSPAKAYILYIFVYNCPPGCCFESFE